MPIQLPRVSFDFSPVDFPGATSTFLQGLNDLSQIVGWKSDAKESRQSLFTDTHAFNAFDPPGSADAYSFATGINNSGEVVGVVRKNDNSSPEYCAYIKRGNSFNLYSHPNADPSVGTVFNGINDSGVRVGGYMDSHRKSHGIIQDDSTTTLLVEAEKMPNATDGAVILGLNNLGEMVGCLFEAKPSVQHGFLKSGDIISAVDFPGSETTYLYDINDLGLMVGSYSDDAAGVYRGFITDGKTFTTIDYPGLPSGSGTFVTGIDNSGRIVGFFGTEAGLEFRSITGVRGFIGIPVAEGTTELKCSTRRMSSDPGQEINAGLFVGWPLGAPCEDGRLNFSTGAQALREALWNLLMTSPGERPMRPSFGAGLRRWIGQPNTETTRAMISSSIAAAIDKWEKRAVVSSVTVAPAPNDPTSAIVTVAYTQAGTPGAPPQTLTLALALGSI